MLNGPICPIYGFGGLLVVVLLHDVNNPLSLFLSSGVLACTLEYASSWAIEKLYHMRFWDYSGKPFNINGRVYLNGFLAFGAGATCINWWSSRGCPTSSGPGRYGCFTPSRDCRSSWW